MSVAMYARVKPMPDCVGRADYISNPDRQENLLAVSGQTDPSFWKNLHLDAQAAWRTSGGSKELKACEAREVHLMLPRNVLDMTPEEQQAVADELATIFREKYGVECLVGLHLSKTELNVHAHVLFSERQLLPAPEIRTASRNVFLDEKGVRKRTKGEILDADGQLRPGCKIIPKGEVISQRYFGEKEDLFSSKGWAMDVKADMATWINERLQPDKQRVVFDPTGPYLAQIHVGKGRPAAQKEAVLEYNRLVKEINRLNEIGLEKGLMSEANVQSLKTEIMLAPDRAAAIKEALAGGPIIGGQRTAVGTDEEKKRELRRLYREANIARKAAREAAPGSVEQKIFSGRAREMSARIDRLKDELGLTPAEAHRRAVLRKEDEQRKKREWILRCRARVQDLAYTSFGLENRIRFLEKELKKMPVFEFLMTEEQKKEKRALEKNLATAKETLEEVYIQESIARTQYKQAKKEYQEQKKELRQLRRKGREFVRPKREEPYR